MDRREAFGRLERHALGMETGEDDAGRARAHGRRRADGGGDQLSRGRHVRGGADRLRDQSRHSLGELPAAAGRARRGYLRGDGHRDR